MKAVRAAASLTSCVQNVGPLSFPFQTQDPFLFCVYHNDRYPAGNANMEAPRKGNGADFDWDQPYRMYHGERIPGFPQHPHRGFETLTATMEGLTDHSDSMKNAGRYGQGDLQWMTAGKGIVHGEMFPLRNQTAPNPLRLFQIWLNLPGKDKMVEPSFKMHWHEKIPKIVLDKDGDNARVSTEEKKELSSGVQITVWAGELLGAKALEPPPNSYASDPTNEVGVYLIELAPGSKFTLPPAKGKSVRRSAFFVEGDTITVGDNKITEHSTITLHAREPAAFVNNGGEKAMVLILSGKPIGEPVAQHGPFVMNTQREIQQAFADYRETQFGGWPWPQDAMVFPRDKPRFALLDGQESFPPVDATDTAKSLGKLEL